MRWLLFLTALSLFAQTDDSVAAHAAAAQAAMKSGDYAAAELHNRAVTQLRPQVPEAWMNLGLSCFLQHKYEPAIRAFEAGLKVKPDMDGAKLFLGISHFKLNRASRALPYVQDYAAKHPTDFQGQYYLGLTYLGLGKFSEAESSLITAGKIDGRNTDVLYHLAQCYLGQARKDVNKRDELARSYQNVVNQIAAIDPSSYRLAQLRAGFYQTQGNETQSIQELEKVLEHDPKARGLHYTLGCLYTEQRQYEKAVEQFEAELQLASPFPRTYLQLGHVYVALHRTKDALPLLEKSQVVDPDSRGLAWAEIGRAYRAMNDPVKSLAAFEKAISFGEEKPSIYYQLAIVARQAGNLQRSREALEKSKQLRSAESPNNAQPR